MIVNLYNRQQYGIDSTSRTCDCGNQEWHGDPDGKQCKHLIALRKWVKDNG